MGTIVESRDLRSIFHLAERALEEVRDGGSDRISLTLKVDARFDREITMESKLRAVGELPPNH